jgi:hypothetical protein
MTKPRTFNYFGSSLVMWHYENIFGKNIFNKTILKTVSNLSQRELNKIESKYINAYMVHGEDNGWNSLNYTGKVKKVIDK